MKNVKQKDHVVVDKAKVVLVDSEEQLEVIWHLLPNREALQSLPEADLEMEVVLRLGLRRQHVEGQLIGYWHHTWLSR